MTCTHDAAEQDTAIADGYCPLCMQADNERLRGLADVERLDVMWQQLVRERDDAARRADYWKAEHLAGNDEIERLRGLLMDARMNKRGWIARIDAALGTQADQPDAVVVPCP